MKRNTIITKLTLGVLMVLTLTTGCRREIFCVRGEGSKVTETLSLPPFSGIRLDVPATVRLTQNATQSVTVTAQENILEELEYDVVGDVLRIKDKNCINRHAGIDFQIAIPTLIEASVSGSGEIITDSMFTGINYLVADISGSGNLTLNAEAQNVEITISGSGDVKANLVSDRLDAQISGSGSVTLSGAADRQDLKISGSGKYRSFGMPSRVCDATISGSGDCEVDVSESLSVTISGSGSVYYRGNPSVNASISGSGRLIHQP